MEKFQIFRKSQSLFQYIRRYVIISIPKIHSTYRLKLDEYLILLNENIIKANLNVKNVRIREKYQKEALSNIAMIELLIRILKEEGIISGKRFLVVVNNLNEINKMLYGWINEKEM